MSAQGMLINGLKLCSRVGGECWTLEGDENYSSEYHSRQDDSYSVHGVVKHQFFHWNTKFYSSRGLHGDPGIKNNDEGYVVPGDFDGVSALLAKELLIRMNGWAASLSLTKRSEDVARLTKILLGYMRDSIFSNISKHSKGEISTRGVHGFWISSPETSEIYDCCLEMCKNAFWISEDSSSKYGGNRIYIICPMDNLNPFDGFNLWYGGDGCTTCCCKVCQDIFTLLKKKNSNFPANCIVKNLVVESPFRLLHFLQHNANCKNLEYVLLSITLDAYFTQLFIGDKTKILRECPSNGQFAKVFENCGCFAILKDLDVFFEISSEFSEKIRKNLNVVIFVMDLIREYTEVWHIMDLPIFLFSISQETLKEKIEPKTTYLDGNFDLKLMHMDVVSFIRRIPYFEAEIRVENNLTTDDNFKRSFLEEHLKKNKLDEEIRYILSILRGYTLEDSRLLLRLAKCEAVKDIMSTKLSTPEKELLFLNNVMTAPKYFERAVSLRVPNNLLPHIQNICRVIPYTISDTGDNFTDILPLYTDGFGEVKIKKGLASMVLKESTVCDIESFLEEDLRDKENICNGLIIEGPSGSGKTSLARALAWEMESTTVIANILDFIRPQVGLSEKLLRNFFSLVRHHFHRGVISHGSRKEETQCVVVLEGLDTLSNDNADYVRRIIARLCSEIDAFNLKSRWLSSAPVLLICTANRLMDLPAKLRTNGRFKAMFTLEDTFTEAKYVERCLELYLRGRCDFMDSLRTVVNTLVEFNDGKFPKLAEIVILCKEAILYSTRNNKTTAHSRISLCEMMDTIKRRYR